MDASNAKRIGAALLTISALYGAYRLFSGDSPKQAVTKAIEKPVQVAHKIVKEAVIDVAEKIVELKPVEAIKEAITAPVEIAKEVVAETPVEKILPSKKAAPKKIKKAYKSDDPFTLTANRRFVCKGKCGRYLHHRKVLCESCSDAKNKSKKKR